MATITNPYAGPLAGRDALTVLQATPSRLREVVNRLGPDGSQSLAPGKGPREK